MSIAIDVLGLVWPVGQRDLLRVERMGKLRTEPDVKAAAVRLIYPDQWLRVMDAKGAWVMVEAYDYEADGQAVGWIARSQLRFGRQP